MSGNNMIDVRDLKPGQRILLRPGLPVTVKARTSVDSIGWATVHTSAGSFMVKLPSRAQLV